MITPEELLETIDSIQDRGGIINDVAAQQLAAIEAAFLEREKEFLNRLSFAVNAECACGGSGPDDPDACLACLVYHRTTTNSKTKIE
jgi:hypothetical protein